MAFGYQHYPEHQIKISAQVNLIDFYTSLGFTTQGAEYDDGGVMHIDMLKETG
jgi:ElaA protein